MSLDTTVALISLEDAKVYALKTTGAAVIADAVTNILNDLINEVSRSVNTFVGRHLLSKARTEYYNGSGEAELQLKHYPIISIASLYNDTEARLFNSSTQVSVSTNVLQLVDKGIIRLWNNESAFNYGRANVKITYTAGYALASVPQDIQMAVRKWVAKEYHKYDKAQHLVQSETIGENTKTYILEAMPKDVRELLLSYRNPLGNPEFAFEAAA